MESVDLPTDLLREIELPPDDLWCCFDPDDQTRDASDLKVGDSAVLRVTHYTVFHAHEVEAHAYRHKPSIIFHGRPEREKHPVTRAYVRFVSQAQPRAPKYTKERTLIELSFPIESLPIILEQIKQAGIFCWVARHSEDKYYGGVGSNFVTSTP